MQMAAEASGSSVSDMAALKVTDVKTGLRPGEAAASVPMSAEASVINQRARALSFSQAGAEYAAGARRGPEVGWGNATRQATVNAHERRAMHMAHAGRMNRK